MHRFPMTARSFVAAAAAAALLAACGSDGDAAESGSDAAPSGDDIGRIVALDDFAAVHLMSLGIEPDVVFNMFEYETTLEMLEPTDAAVEPYGAELDVERVIASEPDLIVTVSHPLTLEVEDELAAIADLTVFDYSATWDEQLLDVAAAVGKQDEATAIIDQLQEEADALATDIAAGPYAGQVASLLADNAGPYSVPEEGSGLGSLLQQVGLARPDAQKVATAGYEPFVQVAQENLLVHDGDIGFVLTGGSYVTEGLYSNPLWEQLRFVQNDELHEVSGEIWLGTSALSVDWVLDDLRAILVDGTEPATNADAAAKLEQFLSA